MSTAVPAPRHLSRSSKSLWRKLVADYGLDDEPAALEVLRLALEALDRGEQARQQIARDGAYITDRFGQVKAHAAVAVERDARLQAVRCMRELALSPEPGEARPPRIGGR